MFRSATQVSPPDPEAYYQLACANLLIGNGRTAAEELQKAIELNPGYWDAHIKLAELMATSAEPGVLRDAHGRLLRTLQHVPSNAAALTALGIVEWKLGQSREAEERLSQVLANLPQHLNSRVALAKMKIASGDPASAEALLRKASADFNASPDLAIALAEFHVATGQLQAAETELKQLLARQPHNSAALIDLAALQVKLNRQTEAEATYKILSSLPNPQYHSFYGLYLLESGKTGQAIDEFERMWKRYPGDRTLRTLLVSAYLAAGRSDAAGRMLRTAVQKNDADYDSLFQESVFNMGQGLLDAAQSNVTRALRIRPEAAEAHYLLAAVYLRRGSLRSSMEELNQTLGRNPQFLPARLALARFRIASKAPDAALALLDEAPPEQQNAAALMTHTCWALLLSRDFTRFRKEWSDAMKQGPSPALNLQDALFRLEQGERDPSRRLAQELLQQNPEDLRGLFLLARNWVLEQDRPGAALDHVRRYADEHPKAPLAWQFLAEMQLASGQALPALASFERASGESGQPTALKLGAASARLRTGRPDLAELGLQPIVAADPSNYPARFLLGVAQQMKGKYAEAAESYGKVLDFNPSYIPALSNLAFLLAEHLGRAEEALHIAEKARELAPGSAAVDDVFGWVLFRRGLHSLAAIHLGDAIRGGSGRALYHLAAVNWSAGDAKGARKAFLDGRSLDATLPEAGVVQRLLEPPAAPGTAFSMPDPLLISWADLGEPGNLAARLDLYQTSRGCTSIFDGMPALLERNPRQFTDQSLLPMLMCDPQSKSPTAYFEGLGNMMAALPRLPGLENARAEWMDPSKPLQSFFRLYGVNTTDMPGWDNTFVSWDRDRKGILPDLGLSAVGIYELSLRKKPGNDDPLGWDIYDSIWPKAFH